MNDIMRFIAKRLCIGVLVVLFVTVLVFAIMQAMPGNPIDLMVDTRVSAEKVAEIKAQWGLDEPPVVQYFYWIKNVLHGDFGTSISLKQSVSDLILQRLPYTLMLTVMTIVLWSMPPFWLGVLFILTFSVWLKILPISGWDGFASLILPAFTLALPALAQIFRLTRSEVLDVLDEKYVTTAYAKGLKNKVVLVKHVLRNAMIPVTVMFFLSLPWLIGGAVVVENVFAWPGMGQLIWKAISKQDFVIIQGVVLVITILTVICNLIGDILAGILDPRIRLE